MSKKYFLKYIQVEGEIKDGDNVFFDDPNKKVRDFKDWSGYASVYTIKNNHYMIDLGHTTTGAEVEDLKKVKLFLCSRDIQVGDKIRGEYPSTLGFDVECLRTDDSVVPHWAVEGKDGKEYYYAKQDSFKVIGEVSLDALGYVKEGDDFDEDQIELGKDLGALYSQARYCKIKGPCGHFH